MICSFRNIYTYLDDCYGQNVEPSLPQLLLMLDSAEVSLAFAWGPDWLMRSVSYAFGVVVGRWYGGMVGMCWGIRVAIRSIGMRGRGGRGYEIDGNFEMGLFDMCWFELERWIDL